MLHRMRSTLAVVAALSEKPANAASELESVPAPTVVVSSPRCEEDAFPLVSFLDSLRVELAGRGLRCCTLAESGAGIPTSASLHVNIEELGHCGTEPERVRITVQQRSDGFRTLDREISLSDVTQAARPRALALAVAELIRSLGEDAPNDTTKVETSAPQRSHPLPQPLAQPDASPVAFSFQIEAETRYFPMRDTTLWGGRMRLTARRSSLHADVDMGANYSQMQTELGALLMRSASIGVGFGPRLELALANIDFGPRAEVGLAWVRGTTTLADVATASGSGVVATIGIRAALEVPANMRMKPCLSLETGGVVQGVNGNVSGQAVTGVGGYYFLAALGLAVTR